MKLTKITTALALSTSLFAQVALADQPCGNYGISTNQQPCAAPQQVYVQPPQAPEAPCAPEQAPAQQTVYAPLPAQSTAPRYGFGLGLGFRGRYNASGYQQPMLGSRLQTRRAEAATPDYGRGVEVGLRGIQDAASLDIGAGLYLRAHQRSGQQRLAIEVSADALGSDLLAQGALMLYLNPNGFIKPFGLLGGGLEVSSGDILAQGALGVDVEITKRLTVSGDIRAIESQVSSVTQECFGADCFDTSGTSYLLGNIGIARKF